MKLKSKFLSVVISAATVLSVITAYFPSWNSLNSYAANSADSSRPIYMNQTTYNINKSFGSMYDGRSWLKTTLDSNKQSLTGNNLKTRYANCIANGYNFAMSKFNTKQKLYRRNNDTDTTVYERDPGNTSLGVNTNDATKPAANFINLKYNSSNIATANIDGYTPTTSQSDVDTSVMKNHLWQFSTGLGKSTYSDGSLKYGGYAVILQDYDIGTLAYKYPSVGTYTDENGNKLDVDLKITLAGYDVGDEVMSSSRTAYFTTEEYVYIKNMLGESKISSIFKSMLQPVKVTHSTGKTFTYKYVIPSVNYTKATEAGVFTTVNSFDGRTINKRQNLYSNSRLPLLRFYTNTVGVDVWGTSWVELKYDFYKAGTNTKIEVKGYTAWKDIDYSQGVAFRQEDIESGSVAGGSGIKLFGTWLDNKVAKGDYKGQYHFRKASFNRYKADGSNVLYTGYFEQNHDNSGTSIGDEYAWLFAAFKGTGFNVIYSFTGPSAETTTGFKDGTIITQSDDTTSARNLMVNATGTITNDLPSINLKRTLEITKFIKSTDNNTIVASRDNNQSVNDNLRFYLIDGTGSYVKVNQNTLGNYTYAGTSTNNIVDIIDANQLPNTVPMQLDINGKITIQGLPIDTYTICETQAANSGISKVYNLSSEATVDLSTGISDWNSIPTAYQTSITNSKYGTKITLQKTITLTDGTKVNATSSNAKKLIDGVQFAIKNENGRYAKVENGKVSEFVKDESFITLDSNGQFKVDGLDFGKYTIIESAKDTSIENIWDVEKSINIELTPDNGTFANGVYSYSFNMDNPEKYGALTINKKTETAEDTPNNIGNIKFYVTGTSDSGRNINMFAITDEHGNAMIDKIPVGTYTITEDPDTVPDGWIAAESRFVDIYKDKNTEHNITEIVNRKVVPKTGGIRIKKIDIDTSEALYGAEFKLYNDVNDNQIYDSTDTFVDTIVIGGSGVGTKDELPIGNYLLNETKAPEGYIIDNNYYSVAVEDGKTVELKTNNDGFTNESIKGNIKLVKTDIEDTTIRLSDAEFLLYNDTDEDGKYSSADTLIGALNNAGNGEYTASNLKYGKYIVIESKSPTGYLKDNNSYAVHITENGKTYIVSNIAGTDLFGNKPIKGSIKLTKVNNEDTSIKLSDAEFTIYNDSTGAIVGIMNVSNGVYSMSNLKYGKYTVKETKTPVGYIGDTKTYTVNIAENGKTYIISNEPTGEYFVNTPIKGNIKLTKVDKDNTSVHLSDAEFTVWNESGSNIGNLVENNGVYSMSNLKYGKYTVRETKTPVGYIGDTNTYTVNITENGKTYIISNEPTGEYFVNTPIKGNIKLTKVDKDNTSKRLSDAEFTVYSDVDNDGAFNSNTDKTVGKMNVSNGVYTMTGLRYGKYLVKETKYPDGYRGDSKYYSVNITENGKTYIVSNIAGTDLFGNTGKPVSLTLTKRIPVDEINGQIWFEHGNPTFIFKVVNTTVGDNYNRTLYKAVEFTKDYVLNNTITINGKKYSEITVSFDEINEAGTYVASEAVIGERYELDNITDIVNGSSNGNECKFVLNPGDSATATFVNVKRSYDTNTHNSLCVNVIKEDS